MPDLTDADVLRSALAEARHIAETAQAQRNSLIAFAVALLQRCGGGPVTFEIPALEAAAKRRILSSIDSANGTLTLALSPADTVEDKPILSLVT